MNWRCLFGHDYSIMNCSRCGKQARYVVVQATSDTPPYIRSVEVDLDLLAEILRRSDEETTDERILECY